VWGLQAQGRENNEESLIYHGPMGFILEKYTEPLSNSSINSRGELILSKVYPENCWNPSTKTLRLVPKSIRGKGTLEIDRPLDGLTAEYQMSGTLSSSSTRHSPSVSSENPSSRRYCRRFEGQEFVGTHTDKTSNSMMLEG
jgi:hypothetical protein